tara:strand:+ start:340 stop:1119 length:780 start_codon:yes stop_codon:yes gene_type:complete
MVFGDALSFGKGIEVSTADDKKFKINDFNSLGFKILGIPHIGIRQRARIIFSMIKFNEKDFVLDAGCGIGLYSFEIYKKAKQITGVDLDEDKINQASKLANRSKKNIVFKKQDLTKLNEKNKFDKIICSDVIEHIPNYKKVLFNLAASLKQEGELLLTFPTFTKFNKKTYKKFGHIAPGFYEEEIIKILNKKNLKIIKKKKYSGFFTRFAFKINEILFKNNILMALFFYPLYFISLLDSLLPIKEFDGIAMLFKKQTDL